MKMQTPYSQASYRAQVVRLRKMADKAAQRFLDEPYKLEFLQHGENTTYKVFSKNKEFLLRLHRNGYHKKEAILEELKWLKKLSQSGEIKVQNPQSSQLGNSLELIDSKGVPERFCDLLTWQKGSCRIKRLQPYHFFLVGELTGWLHQNSPRSLTKHRNYWTAEKLVGEKTQFGSYRLLEEVLGKKYKYVDRCRDIIFQKINQYGLNSPNKMSLIHADLHFGNMVWDKKRVAPIDFDDCGFGFHMYDTAVTFSSALKLFKQISEEKAEEYKLSYFDGYCRYSDLTQNDLELIPYFMVARELVMLVWLYSRKEHPVLRRWFDENKEKHINNFKKVIEMGPSSLY